MLSFLEIFLQRNLNLYFLNIIFVPELHISRMKILLVFIMKQITIYYILSNECVLC